MATPPPPEAVLIEQARTSIRPSLSVRQAAARAQISEGRWRQIAKGYQSAKPNLAIPVRAPAETLARMAAAVDVSAHELEEAGRSDAAAELRLLHQTSEDIRQVDLSTVPDSRLIGELNRRLTERATTPSDDPGPTFPPLQAVARRVRADDCSTYQQD